MKSKWTLLPCLSVLLFGSRPATADEAQVREFLRSYVEAFNRQDLDAVTAMWSESCSHCDEDTGVRTEGRAEVLRDLPALFAADEKPLLAGSVDHVRIVTPEIAQVTGTVSITVGGAEPEDSRFSGLIVKRGDKWQFDSVEESDIIVPVTAADALRELAWLEGSWLDAAEDGENGHVVWTFRWSDSGNFLTRVVTLVDGEETIRMGTDIIGWDPRSRQIRSWSFHSDGSFGDGDWSRSGEDWIIRVSQTLADGSASSGTYIASRVDADILTIRLIAHDIEGEIQPASGPATMTRVVDAPAETEPVSEPAVNPPDEVDPGRTDRKSER